MLKINYDNLNKLMNQEYINVEKLNILLKYIPSDFLPD